MIRRALLKLAPVALLLAFHLPALSQSTEFSYQGSLNNGGVPANGNYDFEFLYLTSS